MQLAHEFDGPTTTARVNLINDAGQTTFTATADLVDEPARQHLAWGLSQAMGRADWQTIDAHLVQIADQREAQLASMPRPNIEPWQPFPIDLIPDPLRRYATEAAAEMGIEPAMVAVPMLVAAAGAIGNSFELRLSETWREPAVLWAAIVAESGSMKSPAIDAGTRFIREHQFAEFRRAEADAEVWAMQNAHLPKREQAPRPAPAQRWLVNDVTIEALASRLAENPRGLLLANDELGRWFGSFTRYDSASADQWAELYGAKNLVIDRKSSDAPVQTIRHAAVSVCGGIQPANLSRKLSQEVFDLGLAARLMLVMPPRTAKRATITRLGQDLLSQSQTVFANLLHLDPAGNGRDRWPRSATLDPEAESLWQAFVNQHGHIGAELEDRDAALHAKVEGLAARLTLIVWLIRWASRVPIGPAIDADSVRAGIALAQWFGRETARVYRILAEGQAEKDLRKRIEAIQRMGGAVTANEWKKARSNNRPLAYAEAQLDELARLGFGRWEDSPAGPGRPTRRLVIHGPATAASQQPMLALAD